MSHSNTSSYLCHYKHATQEYGHDTQGRAAHAEGGGVQLAMSELLLRFPYLWWMTNSTTPRKKQMAPTVMYAIPKNGFFPPIQEMVLRIMRLRPSKLRMG